LPNKSQIISAVRWLALGRFAGQAVSWIVTILVMRILSPEDYGLAAMGATLIALIALISEFGFGTAVVQAKEITRQQCACVFGAALLFGIASFALVAALSPLIGSFYNDQRLTNIVQLAGLTFILASLSTIPDAMLRRELNFKKLSLIDFAATLIGSIVTYVLALFAFEYWALIFGPLTYSACRTILLHLTVKERILPSFRIAPAFQLIKFGGQVAIARLAGYAVTQSDIVFAGRFLGKESLGFYTVALDLALMPVNKVMSIVNQVALPALAKTARERPEARGEELLAGLRLVAYVIFPCLIGIAAIAPWLVTALLGEKWLPAIQPLQIIALALPMRVIANFISTATVSFGRPDIEIKDKLTSAIVFPACFFIGVQYDVVGLATAWFIALPISLIINLHRTRKAFSIGFTSIFLALLKPVLLSVSMGLLLSAYGFAVTNHIAPWHTLITMIIFGGIFYTATIWHIDNQLAKLILNVIKR
jgi:O-antigen/teichoic acid export membrane protein